MRIGGSPAAASTGDMPTMNVAASAAMPAANCRTIFFKAVSSVALQALLWRSGAFVVQLAFVIDDEIVRHRRSPDVERVFRRIVARIPLHVGGNEVDVVGVFGEAAPGVANVAKIIRADHMATHTPAVSVAATRHCWQP